MSATPGEPSFSTTCDSELKMPNAATFFCSGSRSSRNAPLSLGLRMLLANWSTASSYSWLGVIQLV